MKVPIRRERSGKLHRTKVPVMSSEVYRNLGRGGAGNYYSKTDLEDAAKRDPQVMTPGVVTLLSIVTPE